MMRKLLIFVLFVVQTAVLAAADIDDIVCRLENAGFADIRAAQTEEYVVVSLSCDSYKLPVEGLSRARQILEDALEENPVKIKVICTDRNVPQLTMTFDPSSGRWSTTRRLDESWDVVKVERRTASSIGRTNILFYPQISIKNLIINQVYQTLWQISPAVEVSLWPGMKLSYQLKYPLFNDGFGDAESKVHPGMMALSQSFRDPWHLNVFGKVTAGVFSSNRYGLALEAWYYFPGERLSVDTQLAMLANCYFDGFVFKFGRHPYFRWNVALNYYMPSLDTQFTLRLQKFLLGDVGLKYEMIRHFDRCSVGLYAEKAREAPLNVGFRFQVSLPPYNMKRRGYAPRVSTSTSMGMSYNSNNELYYYKEFRTEASDNILWKNAYNPFFIDRHAK